MLAAALFVAALAAFMVSAVAGGGAGLVLVPLLRALVPIESVPAALSLGTSASAASRLLALRGAVRWDVVRRFVPAALPAAGIGAWLLTRFPPVYVELLLACFLLGNVPLLFRRTSSPGKPIGARWLPVLGAAAGLLSGFTGAVGLLFNGFYRRLGLRPDEIVATRAANEVLLHLLKLALYAAFGLLGDAALLAGLLVAGAATLSTIVVRHLLPHIDEAVFGFVGRLAMVVAGAAMFLLSGAKLAEMHRAWVEIARYGPERELLLHLRGRRVLSLETEANGAPAVERVIRFERLPPAIRERVLARVERRSITLVEEVRTLNGVAYEVYVSRENRRAKLEFDPPP